MLIMKEDELTDAMTKIFITVCIFLFLMAIIL